MKEHQRVYGAAVSSRDKFCIAVVEPERDDPYTFLLTYDSASSQPWERVDARRIVNSVARTDADAEGFEFAAISNEGDVYLLRPGAPKTERIAGAGVDSPDSTGLGYTRGIASIDGRLYVTGSTSQVYRRDGPDQWNRLNAAGLGPEPGFSKVKLRSIAGLSTDTIYVAGSTEVARRQLSAADIAEMTEAGKRGDVARMMAIMNATLDAGVDPTDQGCAYFGGEGGWTKINLNSRRVLNDLLVETSDSVWIVGYGGTILRGSAAGGFEAVGFNGDTDTILSFTKFRGRYVAASDHHLHWFNGHSLQPFLPAPISRVMSCLKVEAVDDVLFYFDYTEGVHRFDGEQWEELAVPPELLERSFKGLPKPQNLGP